LRAVFTGQHRVIEGQRAKGQVFSELSSIKKTGKIVKNQCGSARIERQPLRFENAVCSG
jgi:hypothetical protein